MKIKTQPKIFVIFRSVGKGQINNFFFGPITRSIDFLYKSRSLLAALSRKKKVGLPI